MPQDGIALDGIIDSTLFELVGLPLYVFHSEAVGLKLSGLQVLSEYIPEKDSSSLHGSALVPFELITLQSSKMGAASISYEGDGVTRSFHMNFAEMATLIPVSLVMLPTTASPGQRPKGSSETILIVAGQPTAQVA